MVSAEKNQRMSGTLAELKMLNYAFQTNRFEVLSENGLTEDHFDRYKDQYKFLKEFHEKYHCLPSRDVFTAQFDKKWEWTQVTEPSEYLLETLRAERLWRKTLSDYGPAMNEAIRDKDIETFYTICGNAARDYSGTQPSKAENVLACSKKYYDSYLERVNSPQSSFVTTGLKELDIITGGWDLKNESAVICARSGVGKSWFMTFFACEAVKKGLRVGYYSGEMGKEEVWGRAMTCLFNIPNGAISHGNERVQQSLERKIQSLPSLGFGDLLVLTGASKEGSVTVSELRSFIEKEHLDMLCVDQVSLMEDERKAKTIRENFANISKDLRALQREKRIPILIAAQLNREQYDEGLGLRNIAESDRLGQDATTVLVLERKGENVNVLLCKSRGSKSGDTLTYHWRPDNWELSYLPNEKDALGGVSAEDVLQDYEVADDVKSNNVF